jgi:hypothetical protein
MTDESFSRHNQVIKDLLKILSLHYNMLVSSGSNKEILRTYKILIQYLKTASKKDLDRIFSTPEAFSSELATLKDEHSDSEISMLSLDDITNLLDDEKTSRKYLERIAIHRFGVPRGSMRSFSNRKMLVDKLLALIRNEQTHATINLVVRDQIDRSSTESED